jgi:hypothetical protein
MNHVCGAAEAEIFGNDAKDRNRGLRRQSLHITPDEPIEHQIAYHQQVYALKLL